MKLTADEIAQATAGTWVTAPEPGLVVEAVSTDTRSLAPGAFYLALRGENFDGHNFLKQAIEKSAGGLIVHDTRAAADLPGATPVLVVADTLRAYGDIAAAWAAKCPARRVAIVGSSGKTTTKDMLAAILSTAGPTLATEANFNNLVGVPQTLLRLEPEHQWAVVELGMNEPGELGRVAEITEPDLLVLLNIGSAHIGRFGSREALVEAKAESIAALRPNTPILYNTACDACREIVRRDARGRPVLTFCAGSPAEIWADNIRPLDPAGYRFDLELGTARVGVDLHVHGRYNVENAVAATAAAHALGADASIVAQALGEFRAANMRSEVREVGGVRLILDCYNANPESMRAALEPLAESARDDGRTLAVLGEMLELGEQSENFHRQVGEQVRRAKPDGVFLLGDAMAPAAEALAGGEIPSEHFTSREDLADRLVDEVRTGDVVLLKGSRLNGLEHVAEQLERALAKRPDREGQ